MTLRLALIAAAAFAAVMALRMRYVKAADCVVILAFVGVVLSLAVALLVFLAMVR